ncbi:hypothetical protein [Vibrio parahaemolyticus]|uniref:Uncharacterized protein n=1 Tax=Vibrio phage vB_ValM-yong1 TaxID=2660715 RepID=A0A6M3A3J8_9CAUD|nr:hypothetical protein [Vibrio parahaemolyticus]YP_009885051.1 hypothetical protein HYQ07_gp19 [Vibrio phage Valm-yong1]HCZ9306339.1 hypothetical protein [Vibrio alginolyticus]MBM5118021.1 hypothetical protein [Vibrio parahaemolyticus]MBM5121399.1 hypothetical protein [Vibrio parahaemolyticus]MBM5131812.1 hypothetical protein [Vibrio parahaemolyticus]MBM5138603.1 hypothetical protein [Vibrio parahaemolyticus]
MQLQTGKKYHAHQPAGQEIKATSRSRMHKYMIPAFFVGYGLVLGGHMAAWFIKGIEIVIRDVIILLVG